VRVVTNESTLDVVVQTYCSALTVIGKREMSRVSSVLVGFMTD